MDDEPIKYSFVLQEVVNLHTLQQCTLSSSSNLDPSIRASLTKYANRHIKSGKDGDGRSYVYVYYCTKTFENQSIGRMYPVISTDGVNPESHKDRRCMTFSNNMPKTLRSTLAYENYYDIDFKNSHPTILIQLLKKNDIKCKSLKKYVKNRDQILEETCEWYDIDKDVAKILYVQILYGGTYESWRSDNNISTYDDFEFVMDFQRDIRNAVKELLKLDRFSRYKRYVKYINPQNNNPFSAISHILMTIENRCLTELYNHYISLNYTIGSFEYDGMKIFRKDDSIFPEEDLRSGEEFIRMKTGYRITLVEKIMEPHPYYNLPENTYIIQSDMEAAKIILKKLGGSDIIYSKSNKKIYYKLENTWTLVQKSKDLNVFVIIFNFIMIQGSRQIEYNKFAKNINNISNCIIMAITRSYEYHIENFEEMIYRSTKRRICFKNGIYNMETREFIPWSDERSLNIYTTVINHMVYNPDIDIHYKNEIISILSEMFGDNIFNEVFKLLARAIAGDNKDKRWITLFGNRNSGKGLLCDLLMKSFGDNYVITTNSNDFVCKNGSGDSSRDKGWLLPLRHSRLIISNEIQPSAVLDGVLLKEICSAGDVIRARALYSESIAFSHQGTFMICCNDIAKTEPADANSTRVVIDMPYQYLSSEEIENADQEEQLMMRLSDPDIKTRLVGDKRYLDSFISIIFDHYEIERPDIPLLNEIGKGFMDTPIDIKRDIKNYFIIDKSDPSLRLTNSELKKVFVEIRQTLSIKDTDQKLKKILQNNGAENFNAGSVRGLKYIRIRDDDPESE